MTICIQLLTSCCTSMVKSDFGGVASSLLPNLLKESKFKILRDVNYLFLFKFNCCLFYKDL